MIFTVNYDFTLAEVLFSDIPEYLVCFWDATGFGKLCCSHGASGIMGKPFWNWNKLNLFWSFFLTDYSGILILLLLKYCVLFYFKYMSFNISITKTGGIY